MNSEPQNQPSMKAKIAFVQSLAALWVTPIYALLHHMLGWRFSKPIVLWINAVALCLFPAIFPGLAKPFPIVFPIFAVAALAAGLWQRHSRWRELSLGKTWHSHSSGLLWLESLFRWPEFCTKENRIARLIEPLLVALIGGIVAACLSRAFGAYLLVTAMLMSIFQQAVYEAALGHLFDQLDNLIYAEAASRNMAFFNTKNPTTPPPSVRELEGAVASGISPELLAAIEKKRTKKASAPNNLTTATINP